MQNRTVEKMLYKVAALLAIVGIILRLTQPSENYLGLYFILGGHILGVAGILLYMKHANETEQEPLQEESADRVREKIN
ncbi:hypothetical protein C8N40_11430 [Pontibacter mucosus]|uniref:Uncharacterized protein n=1 Tax=Pontibacter mucosus TaxID=1649266 RepID=A0A2T5Y7D6_9BACT|nr:hypothetical protein [Pontibacter mucosus]PTX12232.1 hypothetical protein C8N40_11430 [Pontibacter mucosus]